MGQKHVRCDVVSSRHLGVAWFFLQGHIKCTSTGLPRKTHGDVKRSEATTDHRAGFWQR